MRVTKDGASHEKRQFRNDLGPDTLFDGGVIEVQLRDIGQYFDSLVFCPQLQFDVQARPGVDV
jgi:hypothetical protein